MANALCVDSYCLGSSCLFENGQIFLIISILNFLCAGSNSTCCSRFYGWLLRCVCHCKWATFHSLVWVFSRWIGLIRTRLNFWIVNVLVLAISEQNVLVSFHQHCEGMRRNISGGYSICKVCLWEFMVTAFPIVRTRRVFPLPGPRVRDHQRKLTESSLCASACDFFISINIMRRLMYRSFVYLNAPSLDSLTVCSRIQSLLFMDWLFAVLLERRTVPSSFLIRYKLFVFNWTIFLRVDSSFLFTRLLWWSELWKMWLWPTFTALSA